jgi:hypothetical protein
MNLVYFSDSNVITPTVIQEGAGKHGKQGLGGKSLRKTGTEMTATVIQEGAGKHGKEGFRSRIPP